MKINKAQKKSLLLIAVSVILTAVCKLLPLQSLPLRLLHPQQSPRPRQNKHDL